MLVFGTRSKVTWSSESFANVTCDTCGYLALRPFVLQRYFHVFWIPVFPIGKAVLFECAHCKRMLETKDYRDILGPVAAEAKTSAKTPIYMFAGAALLAIPVGAGVVQDVAESRNEDVWLANPSSGDYYIINVSKLAVDLDSEPFAYAIARVETVTPDTVMVRLGAYGYAFTSDARKAIRRDEVEASDYFTDETLSFARSDLLRWHEDGSLVAALRRE